MGAFLLAVCSSTCQVGFFAPPLLSEDDDDLNFLPAEVHHKQASNIRMKEEEMRTSDATCLRESYYQFQKGETS